MKEMERPYEAMCRRYCVTESEAVECATMVHAARMDVDEVAILETVGKLTTITAFKPTDITAVVIRALERGHPMEFFMDLFHTMSTGITGRRLITLARLYMLEMRSIFRHEGHEMEKANLKHGPAPEHGQTPAP